MKFTLKWLENHINLGEGDINLKAEKIAKKLCVAGLEVEQMKNTAQEYKNFVVGEITKCKKHPNANKLSLIEVYDGTKYHQVVCGAPNVRANLKGVFAPIGSVIPGSQLKLVKANIRGTPSCGMMCSSKEMMLDDNHDEIIELPANSVPGEPVIKFLKIEEDIIFDINVTPDKAYALSVKGIARDLYALKLGLLKENPHAHFKQIDIAENNSLETKINVNIKDNSYCDIFAVCAIENVKLKKSPKWLQDLLLRVDLKPINFAVDLTNYICIDMNRPMHVFDADKIKGDINVGVSKYDIFTSLDGSKIEVTKDTTVMYDNEKIISLPGVIGGLESSCSLDSKNILLECANFNYEKLTKISRKYNISTDSSFRFERNQGSLDIEHCINLLARVIGKECGGQIHRVKIFGKREERKKIRFEYNMLQKTTGIALSGEQIDRILQDLGLDILKKDDNGCNILVPLNRKDIKHKYNIVEEIIRIHGPNNIKSLEIKTKKAQLPKNYILESRARKTLCARGMIEVVNWSFTNKKMQKIFANDQETENVLKIDNNKSDNHIGKKGDSCGISLLNPISETYSVMRCSLLTGLCDSIKKNINYGKVDFALFEIGKCYYNNSSTEENTIISAVRVGLAPLEGRGNFWKKTEMNDWLTAKADCCSILNSLGINSKSITFESMKNSKYMENLLSASVIFGANQKIAYFGKLHPRVVKKLKIDNDVFLFEINLSKIAPYIKPKKANKGNFLTSKFKSASRDLAFVLDKTITAQSLIKTIKKNKAVRSATIFDVYDMKEDSKDKAANKKSIALRITFFSNNDTREETNKIMDSIIFSVKKEHNGILRKFQ